jgi:signal transduction histidine kinase/DNA-binding response OmpR family regulator/HAMP domain-containing protein
VSGRRRLRLRDRASVLVLAVAVAITGLLSEVFATASLSREALVSATDDRAAQVGLDEYTLAIAGERGALQAYLLTRDPGRLDEYRAAAALRGGREAALRGQAARAGVDPGPLVAAAGGWQRWADGVAATRPAAVMPSELERGDGLFAAVQARESRLWVVLDRAASSSVAAGRDRWALLALATPALGCLLLALLLLLWWHVARSILRPVDRLAETARAISRGEGSEIPGLAREDELGQLAQALAAWRNESAHRLDLANAVAAEKVRQVRMLEQFNEAATAISGVLEPQALGRILVDRVGVLLGGAGAILVASGQDGRQEVVAAGAPDGAADDLPAVGSDLVAECLRLGAPIVVDDYAASPFATPRGLELGVRGAVAAPLTTGDRWTGVLAAFVRDEARPGARDLQVLALLAAQATPALEAARLHSELLRAHEELTRTNEELGLASRHKSDFLASMSHELRTPLNAILGFSELLLDRGETVDPLKRVNFLRHIHNNGKHLLSLINDILDLAKVEAGQTELHIATLDLAGVVAGVLSTIEPLAAKSGIELASHCTGPLLLAADEHKVRQMLLNLVSNAIKFTPAGGRVAVEAMREEGRVVLSVSDTGIGIAPDDQEHIFEEFWQVAGVAGVAAGRGTGLGLALTRRLAELHGGRVWVRSEPDRGSCFFLELPTGMTSDQLVEATQPRDGLLVLVIEDDPGAAALLVDTLRRDGYRTEVLADGRDAVGLAAHLQPFAITLDILLPGADGWEVLRALKSSERTRRIPLIVVSVADERPRALALGADDYILKPFDRRGLREAIARMRPAETRLVRVLAIDDDPFVLDGLRRQLEPDFVLLGAERGAQGVELARRARPDVVLLDLVMPDLTGFDVLAALKDDPVTQPIPVVVMTASTLTGGEKQRLTGRAEAILVKGEEGGVELLRHLHRLRRRLTGRWAAGPR